MTHPLRFGQLHAYARHVCHRRNEKAVVASYLVASFSLAFTFTCMTGQLVRSVCPNFNNQVQSSPLIPVQKIDITLQKPINSAAEELKSSRTVFWVNIYVLYKERQSTAY